MPRWLNMTIGWTIDEATRSALLAAHPPRYANAVAHHVTLQSDHGAGTPEPPPPAHARIVGHADDGNGVEALVVEVAGTTDRPSGGTFHITWSLKDGRRARESNDVIATKGWTKLEPSDPFALIPSAW